MSAWLFFEPYDRLLFRDARPFEAGQGFRARSAWPPPPPPVAGAVKTRLLRLAGVDLTSYAKAVREGDRSARWTAVFDEYGDADGYGALRLKGPLPALRIGTEAHPLFPLPRDVAGSGGVFSSIDAHLADSFGLKVSGSAPFTRLLWHPEPGMAVGGRGAVWLTAAGLTSYLRGGAVDLDKQHTVDEAATVRVESHTGIMLQARRRQTKPGMLYSARFIRPTDSVESAGYRTTGLMVEAAGPRVERLPGLTLALGGERKAAGIVGIDDPLAGLRILWEKNSATFSALSVYLMTPAVFHRGWCPDVVDDEGALELAGTRLRLVSAAVGRPVTIARWDLARGKPGVVVRAVPAGSTYHFRVERGDFKEAVAHLHDTTVLQARAGRPELAELHKMGFGWSMVGGRADV
jgi:CRISPR-associated protein Cmr3